MKRKIILIVFAIIVFGVVNGLIAHKEHLLGTGTTVLLKLAPVDPRSLIQGDYMVLAYTLARGPAEKAIPKEKPSGKLVIRLDENGVGQFVDVYKGYPHKPDDILLKYRCRGGIRLGAESFFFQEGHARYYENAKYGELKVAPSGESVLVCLRDEDFKRLGPPPQ
ncbi:GDYXXLXY domain-containing protein [Thermodesulfobacteriota bacterium]